jgi:sulfatase maturation enzyme AslB (radical SAM superfamily)
MRKNNDMYDIIDDIPHQTTNVLNTVNDLRDLALKDKAAKQKKTVEDISLLMQIWNKMRVSSFFIFDKENMFRRWCTEIKDNNGFNNFIMIAIIVSSILLVFQTPDLDPLDIKSVILNYLDQVFTIIFIAEMLIKMVSMCVIISNDRIQGA